MPGSSRDPDDDQRHADQASRYGARRGSVPYVAPNATLVGDVLVGAHARVMYGAVLDADDEVVG
jgi:carbonic anhydrase/acetyltransferase-like protein (isoleucine patch superfamily)